MPEKPPPQLIVPEKPPPPDPSLIDEAPIELDPFGEFPESDRTYSELIGSLAAELYETKAELENVKGKRTIDEVKAELLVPYSNKVFWFVVIYCVIVGVIIIADGLGSSTFEISETILGIIAGSTAVTVIGLIGIVISGLFGIRKTK